MVLGVPSLIHTQLDHFRPPGVRTGDSRGPKQPRRIPRLSLHLSTGLSVSTLFFFRLLDLRNSWRIHSHSDIVHFTDVGATEATQVAVLVIAASVGVSLLLVSQGDFTG